MLKRCLIKVETVAKLVGLKLFKYFQLYVSFFFHSLVEQINGVNFLNFDLKSPNDTDYFALCGIKLHMFGLYMMEFSYRNRTVFFQEFIK